jgi:hypothetical protein
MINIIFSSLLSCSDLVFGSFLLVLKVDNDSKIHLIEFAVCHGFYYDWVGKRHPPGGANSPELTIQKEFFTARILLLNC